MGVILGSRHVVIPDVGVRVRAPRGAAAAGNGLLNALIAYWPGNEASGNLLDAHTNVLTLTASGAPGNTTGIVYPTARSYNWTYHYRADHTLLSTGDVDFTVAAWGKRTDWVGISSIVRKNATAANYEYGLVWNSNVPETAVLRVSADGTNVVSTPAAPCSGGVFNLIIGWHDSVANTINIQVNNGTVYSTNHATGVFDGVSDFMIGSYLLGVIGPAMFWKSAAGGGGVLSAAQRTALYNGGAGLAYSAFTT